MLLSSSCDLLAMAGLGWDMNSSSTNGFNEWPCFPIPATPIACRVCNFVVTSIPALIDHVEESHTADSNNNINRPLLFLPYSQRQGNLLANPLLESRMVLPERHPFAFPLNQRNINIVPPQRLHRVQPVVMQPIATPRRVAEEPSNDGTKPFLQELDKPYSCKAALKGINSDADKLDLTLRL